MGSVCDKCSQSVESLESHQCESGEDLIEIPVLDEKSPTLGIDTERIEAISWSPTVDGFAELAITMKSGSIHIHKVERHTAIHVCRKIMGSPR